MFGKEAKEYKSDQFLHKVGRSSRFFALGERPEDKSLDQLLREGLK